MQTRSGRRVQICARTRDVNHATLVSFPKQHLQDCDATGGKRMGAARHVRAPDAICRLARQCDRLIVVGLESPYPLTQRARIVLAKIRRHGSRNRSASPAQACRQV